MNKNKNNKIVIILLKMSYLNFKLIRFAIKSSTINPNLIKFNKLIGESLTEHPSVEIEQHFTDSNGLSQIQILDL